MDKENKAGGCETETLSWGDGGQQAERIMSITEERGGD